MNAPLLARTVVQTLIAAGVREVVLSPGSRNAGLALALATAHEAGRLRLHVRVDERSAGFLALGLAKASGGLVGVVTTSGTAVANLHPAVAEAHHSGLSLVVMSADRPLSLRDSGSNQTTRQVGLFGPHVLDSVDLADESGRPQTWRGQLVRALTLAAGTRTREPGPVHVNLGLATPLVDPSLMESRWLDEAPAPRSVAAARPAEPTMINPGPRTVVVAGDATPPHGRAARAFAEQLGVPLLAEPSSNARSGGFAVGRVADLLTSDLVGDIERVIVFGHPTLSRPMTRLLGRSDCEVIMVADRASWVDPGWAATSVVDAVIAGGTADGAWLRRWLDHPANVEAPDGGWTSRSVTERVLLSVTPGEALVLGSSAPIRWADRAPVPNEGPIVFANRGLAGIDGTLSTALGTRLVTGLGTTVLLGDLTTVHDLTALVGGDLEQDPGVRVVVVDDHGGAIFAGLEQGAEVYGRHFARVFGTPQRVDLVAAASGLGADARAVRSLSELDEALASPHPEHGWQVIVARLTGTAPVE
ncbi:2-succinyl-5-enolpyruvyl-6-hydroxy-3-cyclohexene-1-carboxylic-acid synthase [Aestuariimicrobium sp. T2.26MG-19.2B]|uniref:2-succinyl-5-enolpyruvyl-6-hydroxy-3- cyclohexene-1-carboxylic-acid synthase n=1 Tax=Aestuariimicrobium sp. T2.26MG-19.2B TaxID=3040679 RepID=UPI0024774992|nr:2-succinyl-5-enolpyruvyl-6-hydroxy-3-cyclohexene-1-carboxylic-acid synthase [Aestuariimicrobium sp. T2.26MG-19.2B]CAI9405961.1 2-succinyl-5-enolpyruvyl-6-hydroxy-3-cyclohexene-1-carboxylate synthase [Aestuariimicrobium sp. T2.26MG-19.2B]